MTEKKRFLFIIADSWGPLGCTIPVARELEKRGHEVRFTVFDFHGFINRSNDLLPALDAEGILANEGLTLLKAKIPELKLPGKVPMVKNFALQYREFKSLFRDYLVPYFEAWTKANLAMFREYAPDAIWFKDQVHFGGFVGELMNVPWATFSVHTGYIESDDSIPYTMGLSPAKNGIERVRNKALKWVARRFRMSIDDVVNDARVRLGLRPVKDALWVTPVSPYLYLLFLPKELEAPRKSWPDTVRFVGPYSWDEPKGYVRPEWLDTLPKDEKIVYATIGTLSNRLEIDTYQQIMDALGGQPYTVVVSAGSHGDDYVMKRIPKAPSNFKVEPFLPNSLMIPRANALVHHGGVGTTMHGLVAGVPAVTIPLNHEHFDFAQRLVERGVGIRLDKKKMKPEDLRSAVARVLNEPSFQEAAKKMKAQMAHYDAPKTCANELLKLASKGRTDTKTSPKQQGMETAG